MQATEIQFAGWKTYKMLSYFGENPEYENNSDGDEELTRMYNEALELHNDCSYSRETRAMLDIVDAFLNQIGRIASIVTIYDKNGSCIKCKNSYKGSDIEIKYLTIIYFGLYVVDIRNSPKFKKTEEFFRDLQALNPDVDFGVAEVVYKCLETGEYSVATREELPLVPNEPLPETMVIDVAELGHINLTCKLVGFSFWFKPMSNGAAEKYVPKSVSELISFNPYKS